MIWSLKFFVFLSVFDKFAKRGTLYFAFGALNGERLSQGCESRFSQNVHFVHRSLFIFTQSSGSQKATNIPFSLVAIMINDWNQELTPWAAPPVFGKVPFGSGAEKTLEFITSQLLTKAQGHNTHLILGGYSLAGLFALWAGYQTDKFKGITAASPSVWYPQWIDYASENKPLAQSVYLSLGDKEEKAKNPVMSQVGNAIRKQHDLLMEQDVNTILEWNAGN